VNGSVRAAALAFALVVGLAVGCSSPEEKAQAHLERGREYLAEDRRDAALIEFNNALRLDPENPQANLELGQIAMRERNHGDALFYYREAHRIAPANVEIGVAYALLMRHNDPDRAADLIDEIIAAHPDLALAYAASSQIRQTKGDLVAGLNDARRAVEIAPDDPAMQWQLGVSYQAMIYRGRVLQRGVPDETYADGIEAFEEFLSSGGTPEWKARHEQARIMASWPGHTREATELARQSLARALESGDRQRIYQAAEHLAKLAKGLDDKALYTIALEAFIELDPNDLVAWSNLAQLRRLTRGDPIAVFDELLALFPDDPDAHIAYAGYIANFISLKSAMDYFEEKIEEGIDPPRMLSSLHNLQLSTRHTVQAGQTLTRMRREYPDSPWTLIEIAQIDFKTGRAREALESLRMLVLTDEIPEAFLLLAKAELARGDIDAATNAARSAVEFSTRFDPKTQSVLAEALYTAGEHEEVIEVLNRLSARTQVKPEQMLWLAISHYEQGDPHSGRGLLVKLMDAPYLFDDAIVEFARREGERPKRWVQARDALEGALVRNPDDPRFLIELINLDLLAGRQAIALERLNGQMRHRYPAEVALLRARLRKDQGDLTGALEDANSAFNRRPDLPTLLDFLVTLREEIGSVDEAIASVESKIRSLRRQKLNGRRAAGLKLPWNHILLSRLWILKDDERRAIAALEEAVRKREAIPETKMDLAYLLAKFELDLRKAQALAKSAVEATQRNARAFDTLGYVYLKRDNTELALQQFRFAIAAARPPQPLYYYHQSIALSVLGRASDALEAIENVLALDPQYPEASKIRDRLEAQSRGASEESTLSDS